MKLRKKNQCKVTAHTQQNRVNKEVMIVLKRDIVRKDTSVVKADSKDATMEDIKDEKADTTVITIAEDTKDAKADITVITIVEADSSKDVPEDSEIIMHQAEEDRSKVREDRCKKDRISRPDLYLLVRSN